MSAVYAKAPDQHLSHRRAADGRFDPGEALGVSNSEVIRSVLEKELLGDDAREEAQAALRKLAPVLHRRLNEGNASDPDLRIE